MNLCQIKIPSALLNELSHQKVWNVIIPWQMFTGTPGRFISDPPRFYCPAGAAAGRGCHLRSTARPSYQRATKHSSWRLWYPSCNVRRAALWTPSQSQLHAKRYHDSWAELSLCRFGRSSIRQPCIGHAVHAISSVVHPVHTISILCAWVIN